jgi:hypothetical protein
MEFRGGKKVERKCDESVKRQRVLFMDEENLLRILLSENRRTDS